MRASVFKVNKIEILLKECKNHIDLLIEKRTLSSITAIEMDNLFNKWT